MTEQLNSEQNWEDICLRCGECCFEKKIDKKGTIHTTSVPCRFLDIHTRNCRIYHQRLIAEEDCIKLTSENLPDLAWLPENCAYKKLIT